MNDVMKRRKAALIRANQLEEDEHRAHILRAKGMLTIQIADEMGLPESTVRLLLS